MTRGVPASGRQRWGSGMPRADRTQRRQDERRARNEANGGPGTAMQIPDAIWALALNNSPRRRRPPCPIDPQCQVDHLHRPKGGRRG